MAGAYTVVALFILLLPNGLESLVPKIKAARKTSVRRKPSNLRSSVCPALLALAACAWREQQEGGGHQLARIVKHGGALALPARQRRRCGLAADGRARMQCFEPRARFVRDLAPAVAPAVAVGVAMQRLHAHMKH